MSTLALPARELSRLSAVGWSRDEQWQASLDVALRARGWDTDAAPFPTAWQHQRLRIAALLGRESCPNDPADLRWHISVQGDGDVPAWGKLVRAAHDLRPGVCFCVGVPPRTWWMNAHPHVLHLYELRDEGLIATYRDNARGDAPS